MSSPTAHTDVQGLCSELSTIVEKVESLLSSGEGVEAAERGLFDGLLQLGRQILASTIEAMGSGDMGAAVVVDEDGEAVTYQRRALERRPLRTVFGCVDVARHRYVGPGGDCRYPLDARLRLSQKDVSPLLQRWIIQLARKSSYGETREDLQEIFGLSMSARTLENIVAYRAEGAWDFRAAAPVGAAQPGKLLVLNFDAKGVTVKRSTGQQQRKKRLPGQKANKRKMATVATVHEIDPVEHDLDELASMTRKHNAQRPRPEGRQVWADLEDRKLVLEEVRKHVDARMTPDTKVIIGIDGCPKLEGAVRRHFGDLDALYVLDWYHLSEYLWDAAKTLDREQPDNRYEAMVRRILDGRARVVVAGLRQSLTKRGERGMSLVKRAIRYIETHIHMMDYDEAIELGAPISTGSVEGACAHVIRSRMQRPGMRWTIPGAQALLHLRAIHTSDLGDQHDQWSKRREAERLHGWVQRLLTPDRNAA